MRDCAHLARGLLCLQAILRSTIGEGKMADRSLSRRSILKAGGAVAATLGMPAILRAAPQEIVIGGPAGAAKYFNADLFPVIEKKLDIKVLYEGTNSLTNLQKMKADKA